MKQISERFIAFFFEREDSERLLSSYLEKDWREELCEEWPVLLFVFIFNLQ